MSIRPNKDKKGNIIPRSWVIDYYPQGRKGKRVQQVVDDIDEGEARQMEMSLRRHHSGGIKNDINPLLRDVIPEWLGWLHLHRSANTVKSIGWALKHLLKHFGALTVNRIDEAAIHKYQMARKTTPRSCNLELDYLKSLITWMVKRKMAAPLPFQIERLAVQEKLPRIPGTEALTSWMDAVQTDGEWDPKTRKRKPGPKNAIIWIMVRCGLRYQEAACLKWQDIDWKEGILYYTAKRKRSRASILPDEAQAILAPIRAAITKRINREPTGLIAPNPETGNPYKSMRTLFATATKRSGVNIKGPHTLRHICGTYTLEATGDLRLVQDTLGHTQIRTTQRYTQISIERLRQGQEKQAHYMSQRKTKKKPEESTD